ncbi:hypothetical protein N0V90_002611 [Kalmusia sp. IMI 367209]|nr:hypothetical protein N0V90_002611 [Kalmusia sp. IMI 367209]
MPILSREPPAPFPLYLLPSIPFRRRRSSAVSASTASTVPSPSSSPPKQPTSFLASTSTSHLRCSKCLTDLIPTSSIISKGFTGRHGRAYLVAPPPASSVTGDVPPADMKPGDLPNTHIHKPVPRQLVTGAHTVSDISCRNCGSVLGWKYVEAEEQNQRYKVGKFILETKRVVRGTGWEVDEVENEDVAAEQGREGDVQFDSQDEDECEDLFDGKWTPQLAMRRRRNKKFDGRL